MTFCPRQCSEQEPGGWEDCVWCTGVMFNNAAHGANVRPSTREEYEGLRVMGGDGPRENPGDGSNHRQLKIGIKNRYDWTPSSLGPPDGPRVPWSVVASKIDTPGDMLGIQGSMGVWPREGHWRRWDRQFAGQHDVLVIRRDTKPRVWWMNPQAPNDFPGEWMTLTELRRYYEGFNGGVLYGRVGMLIDIVDGAVKSRPFPDRTRARKPRDGARGIRVYRSPNNVVGVGVIDYLDEGELFIGGQYKNGRLAMGSRKWIGDIRGRRWVHSKNLDHVGGST